MRIERGNFHRHHFHLGQGERGEVLLKALDGLGFAEHGFAEEIDVHAQALGVAAAEVRGERRMLGAQDNIGGVHPNLAARKREGHERHKLPDAAEDLQAEFIERAEESRDAARLE